MKHTPRRVLEKAHKEKHSLVQYVFLSSIFYHLSGILSRLINGKTNILGASAWLRPAQTPCISWNLATVRLKATSIMFAYATIDAHNLRNLIRF
jgi:hypothetical protein